jgi:hypothetical protein
MVNSEGVRRKLPESILSYNLRGGTEEKHSDGAGSSETEQNELWWATLPEVVLLATDTSA